MREQKTKAQAKKINNDIIPTPCPPPTPASHQWWNIHLTLAIWCGPLSPHPLPPARHQPHLLVPSAQTNNQKKSKEPRNEIQLPTNHIVLPWPTYTEPRAKKVPWVLNKPVFWIWYSCICKGYAEFLYVWLWLHMP